MRRIRRSRTQIPSEFEFPIHGKFWYKKSQSGDHKMRVELVVLDWVFVAYESDQGTGMLARWWRVSWVTSGWAPRRSVSATPHVEFAVSGCIRAHRMYRSPPFPTMTAIDCKIVKGCRIRERHTGSRPLARYVHACPSRRYASCACGCACT